MKNRYAGPAARTLFLIALIGAPLYAGLGVSDCRYHMEVMTLASSQETWLRMQSDASAWIIPTWNGTARVNKPPLAVWLHILVWRGLDPASALPETIIWRARALAALLGLLSLLAVWGIGYRIADGDFGWRAAIVAGLNIFFLRQFRMATYDVYLTSFSTFAVFSGLFAMHLSVGGDSGRRPFRWAWLLCGIFLAAAYLTKGPVSLVMTVLPLATILMFSENRKRDVLGFLLAVAIAVCLAAPWYLYVLGHVPEAGRIMGVEYRAERDEFQPPWYYLGLFGLIAPWTFWLIGFCADAIRRRVDWRSPAAGISGLWFAVIFIVMSLPAAKQQRYILPILPAAGLLAATFARGGSPALPMLLRVHGALLCAVSWAIGAFGLMHPWLGAQPWLKAHNILARPEIALLPPWFFALLAVLLIAFARRVLRSARPGDAQSAFRFTALWMACAATPLFYDYAHTYHGRFEQRPAVEEAMRVVGSAPLKYAVFPGSPDWPEWRQAPDGKLLFYARRIIPRWHPDSPPAGYLMATADTAFRAALMAKGWEPIFEFHDGNSPRILYRASGQSDE